jgi:hypothetical protein
MTLWSNQGRPIKTVASFPWQHEPRTDSQRADAIMRTLAQRPFYQETPANSQVAPSWPLPLSANPKAAATDGAHAWGEGRAGEQAGLRYLPDGRSVQLASAGAVPTIILRMGQAGIAGLRALGAGASAALIGILHSFQNRLGRPPTPQELDAVLNQQSTNVENEMPVDDETASNTMPAQEPERDDKQECEDRRRIELAKCRGIGSVFGRRAHRGCADTAAERYSECLHRGPAGVSTPLFLGY